MGIPASNIVSYTPGVISAGASELAMNCVFMTTSTLIPVGTVLSASAKSGVKSYFGASSDEYDLAGTYFSGFDKCTTLPNAMLFAAYVDAARAAWIKSASFSGVKITALQAYSGTITVVVDGTSVTSASIDLATATSFSDVATLVNAGFTGGEVVLSWNSSISAFFLTSATTGASSTIEYASGTLATNLLLTSATGATISQGAAVDDEATAMDRVIAANTNWVSFTTMWEPDTDSKTAFAEWTNDQGQRYLYICWDTDANAIVSGNETCFGYLNQTEGYNAVACVYNTLELATFLGGMIASIDFTRKDGRITTAFKSLSGQSATVTDETIASILLENGYSFYGTYDTANDDFTFFYNGKIGGDWTWIDPYVNQVWFNNQCQLAIMTGLTSVNSVPYNSAGYALIRAWFMDPINQMINFGGIRKGISLSTAEAAEVDSAAGDTVSGLLSQNGYYLQIEDPTATVRANRGTPVINLWYTDGGAVQKISFASVDVM